MFLQLCVIHWSFGSLYNSLTNCMFCGAILWFHLHAVYSLSVPNDFQRPSCSLLMRELVLAPQSRRHDIFISFFQCLMAKRDWPSSLFAKGTNADSQTRNIAKRGCPTAPLQQWRLDWSTIVVSAPKRTNFEECEEWSF